jgi:hypothetical protein
MACQVKRQQPGNVGDRRLTLMPDVRIGSRAAVGATARKSPVRDPEADAPSRTRRALLVPVAALRRPALPARPGLAGDAVLVPVVLRIVAGLPPAGGCQADHARRCAVRRRQSLPDRHRQLPTAEVLGNGPGERGEGDRCECRNAGLVPMPAQPSLRAATRAPSDPWVEPVSPGHCSQHRRGRLRNGSRPPKVAPQTVDPPERRDNPWLIADAASEGTSGHVCNGNSNGRSDSRASCPRD